MPRDKLNTVLIILVMLRLPFRQGSLGTSKEMTGREQGEDQSLPKFQFSRVVVEEEVVFTQ